MMLSIVLRRPPPYRNRPSLFDINVAHCIGTHLIPNPTNFRTVSHPRFTSSVSDLTDLNWKSYTSSSMSAVPLAKNSPAPRTLNPHIHSPWSSSWRPFRCSPVRGSLDPGTLLRMISWNIDGMTLGRKERAHAAINHLKDVFGDSPPPSIIMLQEVNSDSLAAMLEHSWIRKNFAISNVEAPELDFTIIMVSQHLQAESWFHSPLSTALWQDALFVDIPISALEEKPENSKRILRLCTTHLGPFWGPLAHELRSRQLAQISAMLKAPSKHGVQIAGGLVGGDMNPISPLDVDCHRTSKINLRDVWGNVPSLLGPCSKSSQEDLNYGGANGNTWGYQPKNQAAESEWTNSFIRDQ